MLILKTILVILHIVTAAAWFGIGLRIVAPARLLPALDAAAARQVAGEGLQAARLMSLFIVLTFLFGLGAFFAGGGFTAYGPAYHTSLLLILVLTGVQLGLVHRAWTRISAAVSGGGSTAEAVTRGRKRLGMGMGIGHLLWFVILCLMFWNSFVAGTGV